MKKFAFCCLKDNAKEKISVHNCNSIDEAVVYFANKKSLTIDQFIKIFEVFEV